MEEGGFAGEALQADESEPGKEPARLSERTQKCPRSAVRPAVGATFRGKPN